ncbi:MAG TPA: YCF48-related protein [Vicinamibacterales bacterium]|nr:YCF48-related protein [Vicinamibacterales bacterium]
MRRALPIALVLLTGAACGSGGDSTSQSPWEALPLGTKADFRDIYFADAMHGWIAGGSYEITGGLVGRTSDGGKTWRYVSNLTQRESMSVSSIHFFDTNQGVAATSSGTVFSTIDGGENWTVTIRKGRVSGLSSLFFLDDRRGWAAGTGDVIRTDDGGQNWTPAAAEYVDTSYRSPIRVIKFVDDQNGWVAGMHGYLARTSDGGGTWEDVATLITGPEQPNFWDVTFVDRQAGWVVGEEGLIFSTTDGGATWTQRNTGLKDAHSAPKLERIPRAGGSVTIDAGDRTPGFTVSAVRFLDRNRGWVTGFYPNFGRSLILRTEDGGETWSLDADIAGEELYTLFIQGQTAWAIGSRTREGSQAIYRRTLDAK